MNQHRYLSVSDFECVGNIAKHCDLPKLCVAIEEAKIFDLTPLFCFDFVNDVLENWQSEEEKYKNLINGGAFQSCNGKMDFNHGLKRVWVYYAYARYLLINRFNDTPNGLVSKNNDWSNPILSEDITDFSNKYRQMGKEAYKSVKNFLCRNKADFPKFNAKDCADCGCDNCQGGQTKKLTGFRFTTIRR